jgi:hypothetical protein
MLVKSIKYSLIIKLITRMRTKLKIYFAILKIYFAIDFCPYIFFTLSNVLYMF